MCKPKLAGGLGLRYGGSYNLAFTSKIGWGLINSNDLWALVLCSRNKCGEGLIPNVRLQAVCSNLWKGICRAWPIVEKNVIWQIGDVESIKFWHHGWLPQVEDLLPHATVALAVDDFEAEIKGCIIAEGLWDWPKLSTVLPRSIWEFIAGLASPLPLLLA